MHCTTRLEIAMNANFPTAILPFKIKYRGQLGEGLFQVLSFYLLYSLIRNQIHISIQFLAEVIRINIIQILDSLTEVTARQEDLNLKNNSSRILGDAMKAISLRALK